MAHHAVAEGCRFVRRRDGGLIERAASLAAMQYLHYRRRRGIAKAFGTLGYGSIRFRC
jgi:hypothetical protein